MTRSFLVPADDGAPMRRLNALLPAPATSKPEMWIGAVSAATDAWMDQADRLYSSACVVACVADHVSVRGACD